jgi:hypothetical protein
MNVFRRILASLAIVLIIIQFFRPEKNISGAAPVSHISKKFPYPAEVEKIISFSCYDCHSNNTRYPWYSHIQPVAWWLDDHIKEGKSHLNFDEYLSYPAFRQYRKFEQTIKEIKEDEMPLPSYLVGHPKAALSPEQKETVMAWCNSCMAIMKASYPADSLKKR